jgi:uncharacterized protein (TIGR03437 family)
MKRQYAGVSVPCLIGITLLFGAMSSLAQGTLPSIKSGGVVSAGAFGGFTSVAPGSWIEIYGSNLAVDSRSWAGSDFNGVNAPASLDGTSVTIGGQPAFIDYISSGQVNAQVPSNVGTGPQSVIVKTASGASPPYTVTLTALQPGLLAPPSFNVGGTQYVTALFPDGITYVLPPGAIAGLPSRRSQPGDIITFYGVGFGPVVPNIPAGQIAEQSNTLAAPLRIMFGTTQATATYDGLAPDEVGSYQFDVVVPNIPSSDAVPVTFTLAGMTGSQTLYVAVQNGNTAAQVQSLTLSAASVAGGGTVQGTVALSTSAPAGGIVVALSSSSSAVSVPATVTVPAEATSATFTVSAGTASSNQNATITASYGGSSAQASLTVTGGGTLPQFSEMTIHATVTSGNPNLMITQILVFPFTPDGSSCACSIQGGILPSVSNANPPLSGLQFIAGWNNYTANGLTITFGVLDVASTTMKDSKGDTAQITSGTLVVTLNPQVVSTSGTVTGSFSLISTIATVSGSFTGTYTAF